MNDRLGDILKGVAAKPMPRPDQEPDGEELTIAQMDGRYAAIRPSNRNLTRLHVVKKDGAVRSYQYVFLDAFTTFDGGTFTLVFAGLKHWELKVKGHGPGLWRLYDLVTLHRLPYLREAARDFAAEGEAVLTDIRITDVTPKSEE